MNRSSDKRTRDEEKNAFYEETRKARMKERAEARNATTCVELRKGACEVKGTSCDKGYHPPWRHTRSILCKSTRGEKCNMGDECQYKGHVEITDVSMAAVPAGVA